MTLRRKTPSNPWAAQSWADDRFVPSCPGLLWVNQPGNPVQESPALQWGRSSLNGDVKHFLVRIQPMTQIQIITKNYQAQSKENKSQCSCLVKEVVRIWWWYCSFLGLHPIFYSLWVSKGKFEDWRLHLQSDFRQGRALSVHWLCPFLDSLGWVPVTLELLAGCSSRAENAGKFSREGM